MPDRTMMIDEFRVPRFLYGTAWKADETTRLTASPLNRDFAVSIPRISASIITKLASGGASQTR